MTRLACSLYLFLYCLCFSYCALAWNAKGHMIVAEIAYQQVMPATRAKIDKLISYFNKEYANIQTFPQLSTWPDALRAQKVELFTHWHYIDMPFSFDGSSLPHITDEDNALWALEKVINVVKYEKGNFYERARFLAFLAHIVSDLHQPLHTVSYVSAMHKNGDQGGNLYFVYYQKQRINLHKLWDMGVGLLDENISESELNYLVHTLTTLYPANYFGKKTTDLDMTKWVQEGMNNAKNYVYKVEENEAVDDNYIALSQQVARESLVLAGYRLTALLDQLLK